MSTEPTLPFHLVADNLGHADLRVLSFTAEEELSAPYRVKVELSCAADAPFLGDLESALLGQPAALVLAAGEGRRRLHGTVNRLRIAGFDAVAQAGAPGHGRARIHLEIVPRLALLALRQRSRIFQDRTVREIVGAVLDEWKIPHRFQLTGTYKPRPYLTQHGESDLDFLRRVLAVEGIGFSFAASPAGASLKDAPEIVLFDNASAYTPVPAPEGRALRPRDAAVLRYAHSNFDPREDDILDFTLQRELAHRAAVLGDFDFRRPQTGLFAGSHPDASASAPSATERGEPFEAFFYADRQEYEGSSGWPEIDDDRAQVTLDQLRRDASVGRGSIRSGRLLPAHTFTLEGHPLDALNQEYVVTRVEHRGRAPDMHGGEAASYEARFAVVPAAITHRPPVERGARAVHGAETATVVGPKGEDVHTDVFGRVKVRFHWDRDGKGDEHSSCWLRVAEAWAGQRWGTQFVPRVGMEVLVTFLGGDVDRPLVTGCLYNTTHPTPFRLPGDKHRSGVRTHSSDGSGYNEVSFQDLAGEEQILVQAQRDLDVTVGRDHTTEVERDETHTVAGSRNLSVQGAQTSHVGGGHTVTVGGAEIRTVSGDHTVTVTGAHTAAVSGPADLRFGGALSARVDGDVHPEIGGRAQVTLEGDAVLRAQGHLVAVVGQHDARRSATVHVEGGTELYSTGVTEIIAEKALVLRVGKSSIRITPDAIELGADSVIVRAGKDFFAQAEEKIRFVSKREALFEAEKKLFLQAEAGSVQLTRDARIDGDMVKLNCSPDPVDDEIPEDKPLKPTTFSLVDQDGKPLAGQRFLVVLGDGTERGAVLDEDGKARLYLDQSGEIVFPDVDKAKKG